MHTFTFIEDEHLHYSRYFSLTDYTDDILTVTKMIIFHSLTQFIPRKVQSILNAIKLL